MRHISKLQQAGSAAFERRFLSASRLSALQSTQRQLIARGWQLLAEGGVLVYSTCSLCREQGEDIVEWLMETEAPTATLCPVLTDDEGEEVGAEEESRLLQQLQDARTMPESAMTEDVDTEDDVLAVPPRVRWKRALPFHRLLPQQPQLCIRLDPLISATSGLFIAKLRKPSSTGLQKGIAQPSYIVSSVECRA